MNISTLKALALEIKSETVDGANTATRVGTMLEALITYFEEATGWAEYKDTLYTEANPFTLRVADGLTTLPNNAGFIIDSQKPIDVVSFYDEITNSFTGRNGDGVNVLVEYSVRPITGASNVRVLNTINIGGSVGDIYPKDLTLSKGNGVEHNYLTSLAGFTLGTWEANGGTPKVQALNSDVEIFNIRFVLTRTHKARL